MTGLHAYNSTIPKQPLTHALLRPPKRRARPCGDVGDRCICAHARTLPESLHDQGFRGVISRVREAGRTKCVVIFLLTSTLEISLFFLEVTNYGRLPVEDDFAARMVGLKQTFKIKRVALSLSTQALLQLVRDTGGDVRTVRVRTSNAV